jgi:hypothetical protein
MRAVIWTRDPSGAIREMVVAMVCSKRPADVDPAAK